MSDFARQRQALLSGTVKEVVDVPATGVVSSTILGIPVGNPMDDAGSQRNAPMPFLSLYAGLRPHVDFLALRSPLLLVDDISVLVEIGLIPYQVTDQPLPRQPRPLFLPLSDTASQGFAMFPNVLGQRALLPWPPGKLLVRVSFRVIGFENPLGAGQVDVCAAWAAVALGAYGTLPAVQDAKDLQSARYR